MSEISIGGGLHLTCPEGFHVLSAEEKAQMNMMGDGQWEGIYDPERHILVTAGWKQVGLMLKLVKSRDIAVNMEKTIGNAMQTREYQLDGFTNLEIAKERADGFRYSYVAEEIAMYAESYAMKKGKTVYYFHFYARQDLKEESLSVWEEILGSVRIK